MATDLYYTGDFQNAAFGHKGLRILGAGESSVGGEKFNSIQAVADAQVDFTSSATAGDTTVTNLALEAGFIMYGNLTSITCDSGKIIAYLQ